jgi:hypothetical protein
MEVGRIDSGLGCLTKESKFMRRNISEMAGIACVVLNNKTDAMKLERNVTQCGKKTDCERIGIGE